MDDDGSSSTAWSTYSPLVTAANPTRSCASAGILAGSSSWFRGFGGGSALVSRGEQVEDVACAVEGVEARCWRVDHAFSGKNIVSLKKIDEKLKSLQ